MPDQNRTQTNTPPTTSAQTKAQTLDKTPGTLGANASNSGITIDLPSTVDTTGAHAAARPSSATLSDSPRTSPAANTSSRAAEASTSAPSTLKDAASASMNQSKEIATHALEGAGALLHAAGDKAAESYAYLARNADELSHRAGEALGHAYGDARRAGASVGRFASTHALPLMMIGTGLAWLGMSMRKERRSDARLDVDVAARRNLRPQTDPRSRNPEVRRPVYVEGTGGSKLLAAPVGDRGTMGSV